MAFKGNAGDSVEVRKDLLLYTGIISSRALLVNPTIEELATIGITFEREINYLDQTQEGEDRVRIDFWNHCLNDKLKVDIKTKLVFFIVNRPRADRDKTKTCFINNFGQTCWTKDGKTFEEWFKPAGMRPCLDGEDLLIAFIRNWINADNDAEVRFEKIANLFKGDFSELNSLLNIYKDSSFKSMLIITKGKDNKYYQSIYNKFFARWNSTSFLPWQKYIKGDDRNIPNKVANGWSYQLKEFVPGDMEVSPDVDSPTEQVKADATKW